MANEVDDPRPHDGGQGLEREPGRGSVLPELQKEHHKSAADAQVRAIDEEVQQQLLSHAPIFRGTRCGGTPGSIYAVFQ